MRRFFTAPEAVQGEYIEFDADLAHHMGKVLRLAPGEQVTVCTGDGMGEEEFLKVKDKFDIEYIVTVDKTNNWEKR